MCMACFGAIWLKHPQSLTEQLELGNAPKVDDGTRGEPRANPGGGGAFASSSSSQAPHVPAGGQDSSESEQEGAPKRPRVSYTGLSAAAVARQLPKSKGMMSKRQRREASRGPKDPAEKKLTNDCEKIRNFTIYVWRWHMDKEYRDKQAINGRCAWYPAQMKWIMDATNGKGWTPSGPNDTPPGANSFLVGGRKVDHMNCHPNSRYMWLSASFLVPLFTFIWTLGADRMMRPNQQWSEYLRDMLIYIYQKEVLDPYRSPQWKSRR